MAKALTHGLIFLIFWLGLGKGDTSVSEQNDRLIDNLMTNYKKDAHPETNDDGAIVVSVGFRPLHITVDESANMLETHVWLTLSWQDSRLSWDPKEYQNVTRVNMASSSLWKPEIMTYNSIRHEDYESTNCIVFQGGTVWWIPPTNFYTSCDFDFTYWPWDVQRCHIVLGSWTKSGNQMDVVNYSGRNVSKVNLSNMMSTSSLVWDILEMTQERSVNYYGGTVPWPDITIRVKMQRKSYIDRKIAVLPIMVVCCLTLATFWTFPLAKSRLLLGCLNLLIMILFLQYLRGRLPLTGAQLPMIASFAASVTVLVTIQLLTALGIINLVSRKDSPPSFLTDPLEGIVGRVLCLSDMPLLGKIPSIGSYTIDMEAMRIAATTEAAAEGATSAAAGPGKDDASGWNLLAQAIDRVMFCVYILIILIFMACYLGGAAAAAA